MNEVVNYSKEELRESSPWIQDRELYLVMKDKIIGS